jgi:hypothetical protein
VGFQDALAESRDYGRRPATDEGFAMRTNFKSAVLRRLAIAMTTVIALVVTGTAVASTITIVPPNGKVAGDSYSMWLATWWQVRLRTPPSGSVCHQVGPVEVLIGPTKPKETDRCSVHSGQAVYVNGPSSECSTIEPPPFHGNTNAQLKACARHGFQSISNTRLTIDGKQLHHLNRWIVLSAVYGLKLPAHNFLGAKKRVGRSAAYGAGLLLRRLSPGVHVVHAAGDEGGVHLDLTYRITVNP